MGARIKKDCGTYFRMVQDQSTISLYAGPGTMGPSAINENVYGFCYIKVLRQNVDSWTKLTRHLLCHSKVLRSAPFLQFSHAVFSSNFRKQCLEYGLPVARHRALLSPQHHLRVMRSQRLLSVPSRSMISATGVRTPAWTTPAERRTWLPACSSTTTSAPSLVHQPPVNHRCNVTTRTSRGSWTTPFATRSVRR